MATTRQRTASPLAMLDFVVLLGLSHLLVLLSVTGAGHVLAPRRMSESITAHGIVPHPFVAVAATAVPAVELGIAALAAVALLTGRDILAGATLVGGFALGLMFLAYLGSLIRSGVHADCGCTPLQAPLTSASAAPSIALAASCGLGVAAMVLGGAADVGQVTGPNQHGQVAVTLWSLIPIAWGPVLALLVILVPATVPVAAGQRYNTLNPGQVIGGEGG